MTSTAPAPTWQQSPAELPRTFALDVTWVDIRVGICGSTHLCPVARALNRWLFEQGVRTLDVSVRRNDMEVSVDWHQPSVRYVHTAGEFISAVDSGRPVTPTTVSFVRNPQ